MMKNRLIILNKFNKKDKKGKNRAYYRCECLCGNCVTIRIDSKAKSCGCLNKEIAAKIGRRNKKHIIGKRFGKLIVAEEYGRTISRKVLYKCVCDCGGESLCASHHLLEGASTSCGKCINLRNGVQKSQIADKILDKFKIPEKYRDISLDIYSEKGLCSRPYIHDGFHYDSQTIIEIHGPVQFLKNYNLFEKQVIKRFVA